MWSLPLVSQEILESSKESALWKSRETSWVLLFITHSELAHRGCIRMVGSSQMINAVNHLGKKELKSSVGDGAKGMGWGQRFKEHFRNGMDKTREGRQSRGSIQSPRFVVWGTRSWHLRCHSPKMENPSWVMGRLNAEFVSKRQTCKEAERIYIGVWINT